MPLAESFEEDDTGGDRDVEGSHGAGCRQRDDEVAAFAREIVETFALPAKDYTYRRGVVRFGVGFVGAFVETD
jgi:hypothetical protein